MFSVYLTRINLEDYPVFVHAIRRSEERSSSSSSASPNSTTSTVAGGSSSGGGTADAEVIDRPGLYLAERDFLRGIRWATGTGYAATLLYFYGYHRPRLPFAERPLAKLHHYFYPSAGYTAPAGVCVGLLHGAWTGAGRMREDAVAARAEADAAAARTARAQLQQRCEAVRATVAESQPWWASALVRAGLLEDPVPGELQRRSLPATMPPVESFSRRYSALWVAQRSRVVQDARWYLGPLPPDCRLVSNADEDGATATATSSSSLHAAPPNPTLSKPQVDSLVSDVLLLQHDAEQRRWTRTGGRFALYGMVTMLVAWNSGNVFFRLGMGAGAGVVAGGVVSAMKLDDIWTHL